jgi:hypothetical protein
MSLSDRDKKVVMVLVPLLLVGAFAFLVMKPKREEAAKAATALEAQRGKRDKAVAREQELKTAKRTFAADYTTVVRLGKAVPTDADMASVLVQLERAARGTDIDFGKIAVGARIPAAPGAPAGGGSGGSGGASTAAPVAAGGAGAESGAGQATEKANTAASASNQSTGASQSASPDTNTQTSAPSKPGGVPVGGGSASPAGPNGEGPAPVPGLDTIPLELRFTGNFFELADMFHDLKRFVSVANGRLNIRGRLMTIDGFAFTSERFPEIKTEMRARIFLAPVNQGSTAGASPSGPGTGSGSNATTAGSSPSATPPTAAAAGGVATP